MSIMTTTGAAGPTARSTASRVIVGVDTHKDFHVAAAVDDRGALLDVLQFQATSTGYRDLGRWAEDLLDHDQMATMPPTSSTESRAPAPTARDLSLHCARVGV